MKGYYISLVDIILKHNITNPFSNAKQQKFEASKLVVGFQIISLHEVEPICGTSFLSLETLTYFLSTEVRGVSTKLPPEHDIKTLCRGRRIWTFLLWLCVVLTVYVYASKWKTTFCEQKGESNGQLLVYIAQHFIFYSLSPFLCI